MPLLRKRENLTRKKGNMMDEPMSQAGTNMPWQIVTISRDMLALRSLCKKRYAVRCVEVHRVVGHTFGKPNCHPNLHE